MASETVEQMRCGGYRISNIVRGEYFHHRYFGYSKREAVREFRRHVRECLNRRGPMQYVIRYRMEAKHRAEVPPETASIEEIRERIEEAADTLVRTGKLEAGYYDAELVNGQGRVVDSEILITASHFPEKG